LSQKKMKARTAGGRWDALYCAGMSPGCTNAVLATARHPRAQFACPLRHPSRIDPGANRIAQHSDMHRSPRVLQAYDLRRSMRGRGNSSAGQGWPMPMSSVLSWIRSSAPTAWPMRDSWARPKRRSTVTTGEL